MRIVVTGGAGFLGSHLCDALVARGDSVICVDDLSTGNLDNLAGLVGHRRFRFVEADVSASLDVRGPVDAVAHLASPASPPDYLRRPLETLAVGSRGTENGLRLAHRTGARFVLASTSEVYGDPAEHPQREEYWGNVNPVGPRSVYDEAKRYAEALTTAYRNSRRTDTAIVRIFNTYGPRMRPHDGRAIPTFIRQALAGEPLTVAGDGGQTRSVCYVDDTVAGILALAASDFAGPVNIGGSQELTVLRLAETIRDLAGSASPVEFVPRPADDPSVRCPDTSLAQHRLGWRPAVTLEAGLRRTIDWFATAHLQGAR